MPQPCVCIADSSTPLMLESPIFVFASNGNTGNEVITPRNESGTMNTNTGQATTGDENAQEGAASEGDGQFYLPKRNKISEAWEDFNEFQERAIYYAICKHCRKKYLRAKQSKQLVCGGI